MRLNSIKDVLVIPEEQGDTEGTLVGYADNYMKVQFEGDESLIGQIVKVGRKLRKQIIH